MIRIAQFGEGNFLRTFVDAYFQTLNEEGGAYRVSIIKPIPFGNLDAFRRQNNHYHIVLRGMENGKAVEKAKLIESVDQVIDPFTEQDAFYALAKDPELRLIVSNTTEAGIVFQKEDSFSDFEHMSFPGKLTKFLLARFQAGLPGVYLLPVELIDHNADELKKAVENYVSLWGLGNDFLAWVKEKNFFCNTLVDRIVSGHPKDEETKKHLFELIGEQDPLLSVGEPFGLWAIESKGDLPSLIKEGHHNIDVVLCQDISYYKKRKVRVLNGSHTNLVPYALWRGKETVADAMDDPVLSRFVLETLDEEIVPFVDQDVEKTKAFASEVIGRFQNPYLNHQLTSIALNSISKWKARVLPSFLDYYRQNHVIPKHLALGFAYLVKLYKAIRKVGDEHLVDFGSRTIRLQDDLSNLEYFFKHTLDDFLKDTSLWGVDLSSIPGLKEVIEQVL